MNLAMAESLALNLKELDKVFYLTPGYTYIIIASISLILVLNMVCVAGIYRLSRKTNEMDIKLTAAPAGPQRDAFPGPSQANKQAMRDNELVAVITAAIAAMESASGNAAPYPGFKVKSIRKI